MTLVVDRGDGAPRVHALVVGVGAYRHLPGGTEPVEHDTLGLGQLTSPPPSAIAFAEWVCDRMQHPSAALGTVELLLSPAGSWAPGGDPSVEVELPTLANTRAAFERWYERCDAHPDNVALLYFCGHGVERESQYLLLEDFGRSELALLENAVDIGETYQAMARCQARAQYLFVDACREIPFALQQKLSGRAATLLDPELVGDERTMTALMFATSGGGRAYAKPGQVTRFTAALIRALDGLGGRLVGDGWQVDVPGVQRAVGWLLARDADAPNQVPGYRGAGVGYLHACSGAPLVPLSITCDPMHAAARAAIALAPLMAAPAGDLAPQPNNGGWQLDVPADVYRLTVEFPDGDYQSADRRVTAFPPGWDEQVRVTP